MNPDNTSTPSDGTSQQPLNVSTAPVVAPQAENQASPFHLILVIFVTLAVAGGSIAAGVSLISMSRKPFQSSGSSASNPTNWVSFSNQDGNFNAMFPATPQAIPRQAQAGQRGGTVISQGFQSGNENTAYAVVYSTFSSDFPLSSDSNTVLQGSVQGEEGQLQNAQLVSSNSTTVSGHPAKTYEITGTKDGKNLNLSGKLVLANRVLYNVFTTQLNSQAPHTEYFLNSFKVGNNGQSK